MIFSKNTINSELANRSKIIWCRYQFDIYSLNEATQIRSIDGVFIFSGKNSNGQWVPYFLDFFPYSQASASLFYRDLNEAKVLGATHIHFIALNDMSIRNALHDEIIEKYKPALNQREDEIMSGEQQYSEELNEIKLKLELLYNHESHYLELIKNYKEEIKFANSLQEDLRRERAQFFTQTLKDVIQTMNLAEVDKTISAKWVEDLVTNYTKSIDLSGDLAKTHAVEILSMLNSEAKKEASSAKLDNITATAKEASKDYIKKTDAK